MGPPAAPPIPLQALEARYVAESTAPLRELAWRVHRSRRNTSGAVCNGAGTKGDAGKSAVNGLMPTKDVPTRDVQLKDIGIYIYTRLYWLLHNDSFCALGQSAEFKPNFKELHVRRTVHTAACIQTAISRGPCGPTCRAGQHPALKLKWAQACLLIPIPTRLHIYYKSLARF